MTDELNELDALHATDTIVEDDRSMHGSEHPNEGPFSEPEQHYDAPEEEDDTPKDAWRTAKRLFAQLRNQRTRLIVVCCSIVCYTVVHLAGPVYSAIVVDDLWKVVQQTWKAHVAFSLATDGIGWKIGVLAVLYLLEWAFYYTQTYLMASVAERLNLTLREQISAKLQVLPLRFFDRNKPGEVLSRVTNDLDRISETMQNGLLRLINAIVGTVGALIIMFVYSWQLTLVFLAVMAINVAITKIVASKNLAAAAQRQEVVGELTGVVEEYYQGRDVIKASNREERSIDTVSEITERTRVIAQRADFLTQVINPLVRMINRFSQVLVALLAGWMMIKGRMSIGVTQAYFQYINQIGEPITEAGYMINSLQSSLASAERTFALLDSPEETPDPSPALEPAEPVRGRVEFKHVKFGYEPGKTLMHDVDFVAEPGKKIAIVGSTGAGKTTLINLLMRFYDIDSGAITLDGVNTAKMTRADLRRQFGMVLQDTWLFGGTVAENLAYGKPDATHKQIVAAAKAAHVDHFIRTLPNGYDTVLDNEAANLSIGQRQLLTIARVFLADPAILILDEATSSVDTRTEEQIAAAMNALMEHRTSFVIAHRLSTIRDADLILYMEHGDILEQGTHEQLMEKNGAYAHLYNSQFA